MKPLCQYGFPCEHLRYNDDGEDICLFPFSIDRPPITKEDWDAMSDTILSDEFYDNCPINKDITISKHIRKMLDNLCWACEGTGKIWSCLDESGDMNEIPCPECKGDGLKTKYQAIREKEAVDVVIRRNLDKRYATMTKSEVRDRIYAALGIPTIFLPDISKEEKE